MAEAGVINRDYTSHRSTTFKRDLQMAEEKQQSVTERVTLTGAQLVEYVKDIIAAGNVRRLIIRKPNDEVLMEIPLAAGVAVGGALTAMAPVIAALGAMAALIKQVKVEIVRTDESDEDSKDS